MNYLVAVSGGIDSVVLLDKLASENQHTIIVAHFDHGIRLDSEADARFVELLADSYHFPFVSRREELGPNASEDLARERRYSFLREEAKAHQAVIVTAHHANDIIETIAINIIRGTGWRGLAVLSAEDIVRPLLTLSKAAIREYALERRLEWVEDSTNMSDKYLRNRLRRRTASLTETKRRQLLELRQRQCALKVDIKIETERFLNRGGEYERHFFTHIDETSAKELLRAAIVDVCGIGPTRPQLERSLLAIKTARSGSVFEVGAKVSLHFTIRTFIVRTL